MLILLVVAVVVAAAAVTPSSSSSPASSSSYCYYYHLPCLLYLYSGVPAILPPHITVEDPVVYTDLDHTAFMTCLVDDGPTTAFVSDFVKDLRNFYFNCIILDVL